MDPSRKKKKRKEMGKNVQSIDTNEAGAQDVPKQATNTEKVREGRKQVACVFCIF